MMAMITTSTQLVNTNKVIVQEKASSDQSTNIRVDKLEPLAHWIGKYPIEKQKGKIRNFLVEPLIKTKLVKLIGKQLYNRLTVTVGKNFLIGPIEFEEGFFILDYRGNFHSNEIGDSVTILINKANAEIHVAIYFVGVESSNSNNIKWFHSEETDIPNKVMDKVYWLKPNNL